MVNKTKVTNPNYARDYSIFADPQFAGHATMMDEMREVIGCALVYQGKDLNSTDTYKTKAEAEELFALAKEKGLFLSAYQNRR